MTSNTPYILSARDPNIAYLGRCHLCGYVMVQKFTTVSSIYQEWKTEIKAIHRLYILPRLCLLQTNLGISHGGTPGGPSLAPGGVPLTLIFNIPYYS